MHIHVYLYARIHLAQCVKHGHRILGNAEPSLQHKAYGRQVVSWLKCKQSLLLICFNEHLKESRLVMHIENSIFEFNPRLAGAPLRFFEDSEKTAAGSAAGFSPTLPPISPSFPQLL